LCAIINGNPHMLLTKQVSTNSRPFHIQWLILGLGLLALGGAIGYSITREYNRIDALEQERLMTQAKVVDANLEHQLVSLNMALVSFRNDLPYWKAKKDSKTLINRHLKAMSDAMPGVRTLHITDAEGTVFASNRQELIGLNFSDREYFRAARTGLNQDMLYISPPFKTVLGVYSVNAVKVVLDARGGLAGIVSSTLNPEYCAVLLKSVLYTPGMRASLIHGDGKIFVEVPAEKGLAGMDLDKPGSRYTLHKESGQESNIFTTGRAFTTGDYRMSAWRTIRPPSLLMDKSLMVSVNRDLQGIFASWRREAFTQGGLFGVLFLTAVFGLYFYQRRQQKFDHLMASYMAELQESEENYRSIFQNASIGIFHSLPEGKFLRVNPALAKMFGYGSPEEMISAITNISTQLYVDSKKHSNLLAATSEQTDWVYAENQYRRKDGNILTASLAVRKVLNPENAVVYLEGFVEDITERKQMEEALRESEKRYRELSIIDGLTQLYNSRYFYHQLKMDIDRADRYGQPLTLLLLDLDDFKIFNDAYGHVAGDQVLLRLGQVVKRCLRRTDSAYRYGGEEFTIIMPMTTSEEGAVTAERIRTEFKEEIFYPAPGQDVRMTVSIGVGQYKPQEDMKVFVHRVDQLMYQGKKNGKDRVCCQS
jgi:diguanylate cyclase (GGDEF)-like protein/PAS domain S-box-containing protein